MPRVVDKAEALALLAIDRRSLLGDRDGCTMCALVHRAREVAPIAENEHGVVLLDRFGNRPGHLLVVTRAHAERTTDVPWPAYAGVQALVYDACRALEARVAPVRIYVASLGSSSELPQSYPHLHVHVVPLHEDDDRARPAAVFSWSTGIVIYDEEEARSLSDELRRAWPRR